MTPRSLAPLFFTRRRTRKLISLGVAFLLVLFGYDKIPMTSGDPLIGQAIVIDGDTIEIHGQRIRLFGIDAPESSQTCRRHGEDYLCGKEASFALADLIAQRPVDCTPEDIDPYRRIVATCYVGATDLNRWMVFQGHALAYRQYSTRYLLDEEQAKDARRGLWAGSFEKPWDYRHKEK